MKNLNTKLTWLFAGALMIGASPAMAQIVGSKHDLSITGGSQLGATGPTDQVCVFCHTPHGANITDTNLPLWNRSAVTTASYTRYSDTGTPSFDSAEANVGSVSLACLSCHDGTQAMDSVINKPGSGGYLAAGSPMSGIATLFMTGTPVPMLGEDISNDHPISIPYAAGGCDVSDGATCLPVEMLDPDFNAINMATINSNPVWWVNTSDGGGTERTKLDLPLYARNDLGQIEPFVECGSCHDPHNSSSYVLDKTVAFLRTSNNASSKICVACHNK